MSFESFYNFITRIPSPGTAPSTIGAREDVCSSSDALRAFGLTSIVRFAILRPKSSEKIAKSLTVGGVSLILLCWFTRKFLVGILVWLEEIGNPIAYPLDSIRFKELGMET